MKEIKIENTVYTTQYEAIDGTRFTSKEECEKYDNTARAILKEKFRKLVVEEGTEETFFICGSDENATYAVKIASEEDADTVLQLYFIDNPWILREGENRDSMRDRAFKMVDKAFKEKDILFVGENYEGETYLITTRNTLLEKLNNIDKKDA